MNDLIAGFLYVINGFKLLTLPRLRIFIIIPFIINVIVFISLFFILKYYFHEFNNWFMHFLPSWLAWLSFILWILFFLSFFLFFLYAFVTIANMIAAPFNSFLSEKAEEYFTGQSAISRTFWENVKDIPRILKRQCHILFYYVLCLILFVILFFIPIIHLFMPLIWILFNAWFLSLTYLDYPSDNHRVPMTTVRAWMQARSLRAFGFGLSVLLFSMIPILNFFIIPAAVIGATQFWLENNA